MDLAPRIPPAEVRQHDRFVFETVRERGDVVEVDVPVLRRPLLMPVRDERALDHQHLGFEQRVVLLENAAIGIARVKQHRPPPLLGHAHAARRSSMISCSLAPGEFVAQPMPQLDDFVRVRRDAMRGAMHANLMRPPEPHHVADRESDHFDLIERRAGDPLVDRHDLAHPLGRIRRHVHAPARHPMQMPLPRIERNADGVIEMRVRDEDVRRADELIGAAPDIEGRVQLANAKPRLMPGAGAAFDREVRRVDGDEIIRCKGNGFTRGRERRRKVERFSAVSACSA